MPTNTIYKAPLDTARTYLRRGWKPLPVPFKSKNPGFLHWQNFNVTEADLSQYFNGQPQNIGVLLGQASGGLVDIDLDCYEAVTLAPSFLPGTNAAFGRASRGLTHFLFRCSNIKTTKFVDPLRTKSQDANLGLTATLCEIRSTGSQTIFPGSTHPNGELIEWHSDGLPATVDESRLSTAVARVAAASLLTRYWTTGKRHDVSMALAGGLLRAHWTEDETVSFIEAICRAANDEEARARVRNVVTTAAKLKAGSNATGLPTLSRLLDAQVVGRVCEWLGINAEPATLHKKPVDSDNDTPRKISQATKLMSFAQQIELFHNAESQCFAAVPVGGHKEILNLRSGAFRDWLAHEFWRREGVMPSSQALQDAIYGLSGKARFDESPVEIHLRVAEAAGVIYLDLCDDSWRVIRISRDGWTIVNDAPVKFRRTRGMTALPEPQRGGSIAALRNFINIKDESWPLVITWLVSTFRPNKPFPILALHGEQGSAKSTTARVLRSLIDPNRAALRSEPRDERDLMITATNSWLVTLDNLSRVPTWLSDSLCRLSTGSGFSTRELYSNSDEILFEAMRPILINGIEELSTRSDLLDRTLLVSLPTIPDHRRRTETEFWREFETARPSILGALLDAVSGALREYNSVLPARLPRMADFAQWATAAESSLGLAEGAFLDAYTGNRTASNDLALEASPVAAALLPFVEAEGCWTGTSSELLGELNRRTRDDLQRQPGWPKASNSLSGILKRLAPNLRAAGVNVTRPTRSGKMGSRLIQLEYKSKLSSESSDRLDG